MQDYRKLYVWQKAHALGWRATGISGNLTRAWRVAAAGSTGARSLSIPSNIAEGAGEALAAISAGFFSIIGIVQRT